MGQALDSPLDSALDTPLDTPLRHPSARSALAAMKPSPISQMEHPAALSQTASSLAQKTTPSASDSHPHLLFLKTGGGSTVAQPKHQLTPQQLQMLADGTGTLEGLTVGPYSPLAGSTKPVNLQSGREGTGLQGSSLPRHQGPLGIATVMLAGEDDSQQLASLFTPRHDWTAGDEPAVQGISRSTSQQQPTTAGKAPVSPTAKSLQAMYLNQAQANKAGVSVLGAAASRRGDFPDPDSLLWLDEVPADHAGKAAEHEQDSQQEERAAIEGPLHWETLNGRLQMDQGSPLEAGRQPAGVQKSTLSQPVLLTLVLSIATNDPEVSASRLTRPANVLKHVLTDL